MAVTTTKTTRSITLRPGERAILPADATVKSIVTEGSIYVQSTCGNLPDPTQYKCGYFIYVRDNDAADTHPMDESRIHIGKLTVGNAVYNIDETGNTPSLGNLNLNIADRSIFSFTNITDSGTKYEKRKYFALWFKVPQPLFDTLKLEIIEKSGVATFIAQPVPYECGKYDFAF